MTVWNDMIIGVCLLLLVWLLWKEVRRVNRLRLPARMAASVLAVVSLACLALPLSYSRKIKNTLSSKEAVLLTEGYDPDSLRVLIQTTRMREGAGGEMQVFSALEDGGPMGPVAADLETASSGLAGGGASGTDLVGSATAGSVMPASRPAAFARLHVLGYGLTRQQWAALHPPPLVFHPSPPRTGIVSVSWKQKLIAGEKCRIQGRIGLASGKPVKLLLTGMGLSLDSVVITGGASEESKTGRTAAGPLTAGSFAGPSADFELSTIPAQVGRSVYQLLVLSDTAFDKGPGTHATAGPGAASPYAAAGIHGDASTRTIAGIQAAVGAHDTLERESLPLEVLPAKKLKILLLAASPDFENTFLANWLASSGHAVAIRTAISRGKWDKAYLNMPETALDPLTPSLLDKFDLIIADAAALQEGGETERLGLRRQVAEKGLGLIIKTDSTTGGWGGIPVVPLRKDSLSRVVVSNGIYGAGKVIFTMQNTTYSRMLGGARKQYAAYWSEILQKVARASIPEEDWQFSPHLPRANEPVAALLQTNKTTLPQGQFASTAEDPTTAPPQEANSSARAVYLAQDPRLSFFWSGVYWPSAAGWQSSATLQGEPGWWYAWSGEDWRPLTRRERGEETEEYIAAQRPAAAGSTEDHAGTDREAAALRRGLEGQRADSERVPFPKSWFYVAFLLSCLFLWVERKI